MCCRITASLLSYLCMIDNALSCHCFSIAVLSHFRFSSLTLNALQVTILLLLLLML